MDFTAGQYLQLGIALATGVVLFVIAYAAPARYIVTFLIVTVPFQLIASRYGSVNMVLIYLAGFAFALRGRMRVFPLLWAAALIFFAYALSLSQTLRATYLDHVLYLVAVGANFVLFYLVYNYFRESENPRVALNVLIWVAALVDAYCMLSLLVGFDRFALMGIQELSLGENIEGLQRLVGPFNAPGTNAEFLALQILLLGYVLLHEKRRRQRIILFSLLLATFAFLVATGSRGGFVALMGGALVFLFLFRSSLGTRALLGGALTVVGFGVVALAVTQFTEFNVLFDRLQGTEFEGIVPESRTRPFELAMERIPERWVIGHGPRIRLISEEERQIPNYVPFGGYPHNLYLFLLYTVGVVGLFAYLTFFVALLVRWAGVRNASSNDALLKGLPRLAIVLMLVFLASQFRIEFLRFLLTDYQNYVFALWGMLLAYSDNLRATKQRQHVTADSPEVRRILAPKRNNTLGARAQSDG